MMMMANSHTGLCVWRTDIGRMHANLKGRDFFGDVVGECRSQGIHPIAYFSVIYDNYSFEHHPDWRIYRADGDDLSQRPLWHLLPEFTVPRLRIRMYTRNRGKLRDRRFVLRYDVLAWHLLLPALRSPFSP